MRNRLPVAVSVLLATWIVGGCGCSDDGVEARPPDGLVSPAALNLGEVCNESASEAQSFTITNRGSGVLDGTVRVTGPDADFFVVDPERVSVPGNASTQVTVTYHPTGNLVGGVRHQATVVVTYQAAGEQKTLEVDVDGVVSDAPVEPRVAFGCGPLEGGEQMPACHVDDSVPCCGVDGDLFRQLGVGDTRIGQTSKLPLVIRNLGCGELTVSKIELDIVDLEGFCTPEMFALPGVETPVTIAGGKSHTFEVEFTPTEVCEANGKVLFETNDPARPTAQALIAGGGGVAPMIQVDPPLVNFREEVTPGNTGTKEFVIRNIGTSPVRIETMEIEGPSTDFSLQKAETAECGGGRTPVEWTGYVLAPTDGKAACGADELFVTVEYAPGTPANLDQAEVVIQTQDGTYSVTLRGGVSPKIVTTPDALVEFLGPQVACSPTTPNLICSRELGCANMCERDTDCPGGERCIGATETEMGTCGEAAACLPICGESRRVVEVCNEGRADLVLGEPRVAGATTDEVPKWDDGPGGTPLTPVFRLGNPDPACAQPLAEGECCNIEVIYTDKLSNTARQGRLIIPSNDPDYASKDFEIILYGDAPQDNAPTFDGYESPLNLKKLDWVKVDLRNLFHDDYSTPQIVSWKLANVTALTGLPVGTIIDRVSPNANCPPSVNGGACFIWEADDVLSFFADVDAPNVGYTFEVTVRDDVCDPPNERVFSITVTVP